MVSSASPIKDGWSHGLTTGSAAFLDDAALAAHEYGHTLQFIGISFLGGATKRPLENTWLAYLSLGAAGYIGGTSHWWELNADHLGGL